MSITHPLWLLVAAPALLAVWVLPRSSRMRRGLRVALVALIALALSAPYLPWRQRGGTLVILADRSASISAAGRARQEEAIRMIHAAMPAHNQMAVVSFGAAPVVEHPPQAAAFSGFAAAINPDGSDLGTAVQHALALIEHGRAGRCFVLSDGAWTGNDPRLAAGQAAARGIAVDYRAVPSHMPPLRLQAFDVPHDVPRGAAFMLTAWLRAAAPGRMQYELRRNDVIVAQGEEEIAAGIAPLLLRDLADEPGLYEYTLRCNMTGQAHTPHVTARALVQVRGPRPVLHLAPRRESGLGALLRRSGLDVRTVTPGELSLSLPVLASHAAVILENVPARALRPADLELLAAWVQYGAGGLLMTGGRHSFGNGGYFNSALDPVLPVSMELRQEHRAFASAIVVALDRSGSMMAPVGGAMTKMDLANIGTASVLDLLTDADEFGVIAVDSSPHTVVPLCSARDARAQRHKILSIKSEGGGIFIYEALVAATRMLQQSARATRHVILFADAADAEAPGMYYELIAKCVDAGMTFSVVGLGSPTDCDAELLRDIARRGNGRCEFTADANALPQLFVEETFAVLRSGFVDTPATITFHPGSAALGSMQFATAPTLGGYNLCYLKPDAQCAASSADDNTAPIIASHYTGSGRVVCFLGEADGPFSGTLPEWPRTGALFAQLARWSAGALNELPPGLAAEQAVEHGQYALRLHVDPTAYLDTLRGAPHVTLLVSTPGRAPYHLTQPLQWRDAETLTASMPLDSLSTVRAMLALPSGPVALPPVCLPCSPELMGAPRDDGARVLEEIAAMTGGSARGRLVDIWNDLPRTRTRLALAPWLYAAAALLFLCEIMLRRLGVRLALPRVQAQQATPPPSRHAPPPPTSTPASPGKPSSSAAPPPLHEALHRAQQRAARRLKDE